MKTFNRIGVGITTYLAILRRQIAKLSGRRLARFIAKFRERSLSMVWQYSVEAIRDGRVIGRRTGVGLNTNNWGAVLAAILSSPAVGGYLQVSLTDITGTADSVIIYEENGAVYFTNTTYTFAAYVQLGTGTTAATRSDYKLEAPITGNNNPISFSYTNGSSTISSTVTISFSTAQSPSELGLFEGWAAGPSSKIFLIDHAVFSPLPAATSFSVTYSMSLS